MWSFEPPRIPFESLNRSYASSFLLPALVSSVVLIPGCEASDHVVATRSTPKETGGAAGGALASGGGGGASAGGGADGVASLGGASNLERGLVFHLPFDGDLIDRAGGRVAQQVSGDGAEVEFVPGVSGLSLDLSQVATHLTLENEPTFALEDLTMSFWARSFFPNPNASPQTLLGFGRACLDSYHCGLYPDETVKCSLVDGRGWCEDAITLDADWTEGEFVHVAFVVDQDASAPLARLWLYLNGELANSEERIDYFPVDEPERPFVIGANYQQVDGVGAAPYLSRAQIDDARLYDRALSGAEVRLLFEQHRDSQP